MSPYAGVRTGGLDAAALAATIRERFRATAPARPRVGVEVEAIPVDSVTRRPIPPEASDGGRSLVPRLRAWARENGWVEGRNYAGAPAFTTPRGGTVSFEPGGQIEYASAPRGDLAALDDEIVGVFAPLARALAVEGVALVARGVDPETPLAEARLHLGGERYRRMADHYARRGPWGRRMMRQTAALHLNVDATGPPLESWRAATNAAPALLAAFANSPRVEGGPSGHRSARAAQWRALDPGRTGLVATGPDPEGEYLDFALGADAFLLGPPDAPARPFRAWLDRAEPPDWTRHLSTLFPEIRPRGYLEIRCVDALPLRWVAVPAALLVGLLFDADARRTAAALPAPAPDLLERAGRLGLADPEVARRVARIFDLALEGLSAVEPTVASPCVRDRVEAFRRSLTDRGLDPGSIADDELLPG